MMVNGEMACAHYASLTGVSEGPGDWFEITQQRIDAFADVTEDRQFIHVDPVKAAALSPWRSTIAHGFLTLSLLPVLMKSIPDASDDDFATGMELELNYGFDKVRFISPVPVLSRVRATRTLAAVELRDPDTVQFRFDVTIEIEGVGKPACVAEWVILRKY